MRCTNWRSNVSKILDIDSRSFVQTLQDQEVSEFLIYYSINYVSSLVDYSIAEDSFILLTLSRNTSRICIRINIINDTIWEDLYEDFTVKIDQARFHLGQCIESQH